MATHVNRLTATSVKTKKPGMHADGGLLYLLVKPDGRRSWIFRYRDRITTKLRDMGLGPAWDVSLSEARERAAGLRRMLRDGQDPMTVKHAEKAEARAKHEKRMAFGRCAELYIETHRSGWKNPKHAAQWDSTLRTYCVPVWQLPVDAIDTALVMKCLEGKDSKAPLWNSKPETMSRVRGRIESVLAWATVRGLRIGDNPAAWRNHLDQLLPARNKVQAVKHRAALPYVDAAAFMAELRQRDTVGARVLELQMLTATRPGEAAGARWAEFDLDGAVWTIPGSRMKAGKEHRIPLAPAAVKLLRGLPRINDNVFPGVRDRSITTAAAMKLLKELRPGLTAHGFRSTFRDWAAETTSHSREVIEAAMAHRLKDAAEAAYQRGDLLQRRAVLMKDWAAYCAAPRAADNVTALQGRKHRAKA
ncbi:site-specific integrase [Rhodanobacter sp. L36]|uniref:tyrosine-type recombinase/integrase n=1 Tax=Rhodanobacter sp. L36 TaxID=1747221 RepID=UPI00131E16BD|nr:site-specific integrase [Rhodanobacter sp. L36]